MGCVGSSAHISANIPRELELGYRISAKVLR
jgi:hypothetical protein